MTVGKEIEESKNVTIKYSTLEDGVKEEEFDLVVLSVGLNPPKDVEGLAKTFDIELNEHGFCKIDPTNPIKTTREGDFCQRRLPGADGYPRVCGDRQWCRGPLRRASQLSAR